MDDPCFRIGEPTEYEAVRDFLWKYGPNQWNHLPEKGIEQEFRFLQEGKGFVVVAMTGSDLAGFAISLLQDACPEHLWKYTQSRKVLFIADVVVNPSCSGRGYGTKLLSYSIEEARSRKMDVVFIERHEENLASAGMMRKAGFSIVDTFHDPAKRSTGSRNSSILKMDLA